MTLFLSSFRYTCIRLGMSLNAGVAFFILLLFASNSFASTFVVERLITISCSGSVWGQLVAGSGYSARLSFDGYDPATGYVSASMNVMGVLCNKTVNVGIGWSFANPSVSDPLVSFSAAISSTYVDGYGETQSCSGYVGGSAADWAVFGVGSSPEVGWCGGSVNVSGFGYFNVRFIVTSEDLLPCSEPTLVSAPECQGGQGLFMRGSGFVLTGKLLSMYGSSNGFGEVSGFGRYTWANGSQTALQRISPAGAENDPSTLPNGTQCNNFNQGDGQLLDIIVCPLGDNLSSSSSSEPSSSSSEPQQSSSSNSDGSSDSQGSSGSSDLSDKCHASPWLPECSCTFYPNSAWCNECVNHPELAFCNGNGNGNCTSLNDCNWARIDVQLEQYGVEKDIRDKLKDLYALHENGYNLTQEQNGILNGVIGAINSGSEGSIGAINGLGERLEGLEGGIVGGIGDKMDGMLDGIKDYFGDLFGNGDCEGDGCAPGGTGTGDTTGMRGKANSLIAGGGKSFKPWTDSQIDALIPSKIATGQCPVIDKQLSFFGTSIPFKIDFNNLVKGSAFDVVGFIKACLLIIVYFINCWSMITIFRTGGRQ